MFEETLTYVTDGYMLSNAAILGAFGLVHWQQAGKAARGGWTGVYDQLLSWEKQAALMLAIILCVKVCFGGSICASPLPNILAVTLLLYVIG